MKLKNWGILASGLLPAGLGCSSSDDVACKTIGCGSDVQNTGGVPPGSDWGAGGLLVPSTGGSSSGLGGSGGFPGDSCDNSHKPETLPPDLFILLDQSISMDEPLPPPGTGTWWQAAQTAIETFVNSQDASRKRVGVGLHYFPLGGVEPTSCIANYSTPEVAIADLPGNAPALVTSVRAHGPGNFTPTRPALAGAIAHMKQWAPSRPGRAPAVVLVTDGFPSECPPRDIADVAAVAEEGFETAKVRTFVVGFKLGPGKENLNYIAKAGGTDKAFFIDQGDVGAQFVAAMLSITDAPLECSFNFPTPTKGEQLDLKKVFVQFTPTLSPSVPEPLPFLHQPGDCVYNNDKGFFYDNPQTPKKIVLCPGSCEKLAQGTLEIKLGCRPPTEIPM